MLFDKQGDVKGKEHANPNASMVESKPPSMLGDSMSGVGLIILLQ